MGKKNARREKVKRDRLEVYGIVLESHKSALFSVRLKQDEMSSSEVVIQCTICGKMRENFIRIVPGDAVRVELSPYDMTKGRIVSRVRANEMNQQA